MYHQPVKRTIHHIEAFVGRRISSVRWAIPAGYQTCEITGKLHPESALEVSFPHYLFDKTFLTSNGIYCEDAAWLSDEGYDFILNTLNDLGVLEAFYEALEHRQDFIDGLCWIGATGLVWSADATPTPLALVA